MKWLVIIKALASNKRVRRLLKDKGGKLWDEMYLASKIREEGRNEKADDIARGGRVA